MKFKKATSKTVITTILLVTIMSCSSNDDTTIMGSDSNGDKPTITIGDEPIKATDAFFSGSNSTSQNNSTTLTYDLDHRKETSTTIKVLNADSNYTYKLQLTGRHTENIYVVNTKVLTLIASKVKSVGPVPVTPSETYHFNLTDLDMETDFYTAILVEENSGKELVLGNVGGTDTRALQFIDSGNSNFYTTMRLSEPSGGVASSGHPHTYGIKMVPNNLGTHARAQKDPLGHKDAYISFYDTTTGSLVKSTRTFTSGNGAGDSSGTYHTQRYYISPAKFDLPGGVTYNVRLEYKNIETGVVVQYSPFISYKIKAAAQVIQ